MQGDLGQVRGGQGGIEGCWGAGAWLAWGVSIQIMENNLSCTIEVFKVLLLVKIVYLIDIDCLK